MSDYTPERSPSRADIPTPEPPVQATTGFHGEYNQGLQLGQNLGTINYYASDGPSSETHSVTSNRHFDIPQPVSSIYTGRQDHLQQLKDTFIRPTSQPHQKRFVIQGIGGSGKTQFCSKFAQDNRDDFWGVFWVDLGSSERTKFTFAQIAKAGEVDPNRASVLHWLSNLDGQWLLIIDNADDPDIDLDQYFPPGDRGCVLITTRNPAQRYQGNIGPGFFEFHSLDDNDARELLLRAAQQSRPWDSKISNIAAQISRKLACVALAITQAGAAIRSGLCTLRNYLQFYDEIWTRGRGLQPPHSDPRSKDAEYMSIYGTYEVSFERIERKQTQASRDAIQLLKTFAFLSNENIKTDIVKKAITNKGVEGRFKKDTQQIWPFAQLKTAIREINRGPAPLPHLIRDCRYACHVDISRLGLALKELIQTSLVYYHEGDEAYSMHPLIHQWVRERPQMQTAEQLLWAEVAATTLACSIVVTKGYASQEDEAFSLELLPHVDHVYTSLTCLEHRMAQRRSTSRRWRTIPNHRLNWHLSKRLEKFSVVILEEEGGKTPRSYSGKCWHMLSRLLDPVDRL